MQRLALEQRRLLGEILAEPRARVTFAFEDDDDLRGRLAGHGFTKPEEPMHFLVRSVEPLPPLPELPEGFRYRTVEAAMFGYSR